MCLQNLPDADTPGGETATQLTGLEPSTEELQAQAEYGLYMALEDQYTEIIIRLIGPRNPHLQGVPITSGEDKGK